jgi:flagellar biosynthesis protein FlhB
MADDAGKTEDPTPKKLREAREQGQFARTQDASTWAAIAAMIVVLPMTAARVHDAFRDIFAHLPEVGADPTTERALGVLADLPVTVLMAGLPVYVAAFVAALAATASQGVHPSKKALKPKFKRMSPKQGLKRMFGTQALWEAAKALLKVVVIAAAVVFVGQSLVVSLMGGGLAPIGATVSTAWVGLRSVLWAAVAAGALLAVADYAVQKKKIMKQLKMSVREVRDEHKQAEGDPLIKSAIRSRQIAMSRNRMLANVADADAVLVNPTHIAVAVRYEAGRGAPRVVAKGAGALAMKIRAKAVEHRVPIIEDRPLARALHRVCEVGDEIPAELYLAVARILAFVMATAQGRAANVPRPGRTTVPDLPTKSELKARRVRELREARGQGR